MGKYIFSLGEIGLWELIRPLGLPLLYGLFWRLGFDAVLSAKLLSVFFSLGILVLAYLIAKHVFGTKVAALSSAVLAFSPIFFTQAFSLLSGIPSLFFVLLAVYFYSVRGSHLLTGFFAATAFLFRFPMGLIVLPFFLAMLSEKKNVLKKVVLFSFAFALVVSPFLVLNAFLYNADVGVFRAAVTPLLEASAAQSNIVFAQGFFYYFPVIFGQSPMLLFVMAAFYFYFKNRYLRSPQKLFLIYFTLIFFLYFSLIINKVPRFAVSFLVPLAILSSFGFFKSLSVIKSSSQGKRALLLIPYSILALTITVYSSYDVHFLIKDRAAEHQMTAEFYHYLDDKQVGTLLTTDPVFAVFTDAKIVPIYSTYGAMNTYNAEKNRVDAVAYNSAFEPCFISPECETRKKELLAAISKDFRLVFEKNFSYRHTAIFLPNQS